MKTQPDYAANLEECLLLSITAAAFYLNLAKQNADPCLSGMFLNFSRILERNASLITDMVSHCDAPHLNPAFFPLPEGDAEKDCQTGLKQAIHLKSRLLMLAAYAPAASDRHTLLEMAKAADPILDFCP